MIWCLVFFFFWELCRLRDGRRAGSAADLRLSLRVSSSTDSFSFRLEGERSVSEKRKQQLKKRKKKRTTTARRREMTTRTTPPLHCLRTRRQRRPVFPLWHELVLPGIVRLVAPALGSFTPIRLTTFSPGTALLDKQSRGVHALCSPAESL